MPALLARLGSKEVVLPQALLERFGGQRGLLAFYERFLRSPNLVAFLHLRRLAAEEWQRQEWAAAARAPQEELLSVESFFLLEQQLAKAQQQPQQQQGDGGGGGERGGAAALADQLQEKLRVAFSALPPDLQQAILHTPSHAAFLGDQQQQEWLLQQAQLGQQAGGAGTPAAAST